MFLAALTLLAAACSQEEGAKPGNGKIRVCVGAPDGPSPLTAIGDDGITARWEPGDRIGLWAAADEGFVLAAEPFTLWHYGTEYPTAVFTAEIDPMAAGSYTYYALHPAPATWQGTAAEYEIPAVQDGTFDGTLDLMVAEPVRGGELTAQSGERIDLHFRHLTHVLRITIPEDKNLAGQPLTGLEIAFPAPVVGRVRVDAADTTPEIAFVSGGGSVLRLEFAEPVDAGATVWAVIAPCDLTGGELVFKGLVGKRESETVSTPGRLLAAGHTTPIALTIPKLYHNTRLNFSLGENHLGEAVREFTLTAPEGCDLGAGSNVRTFTVNDRNHYEINFEGDFTDQLSGRPITVAFDSENALVSDTFTMPQLNADENNDIPALTVPYLMAQDFDTIGGKDGYDIGSEWKSTDPNNTAPSSLDGWGLTGWTGSRAGVGPSPTSLRISCNTIIVFGNPQSRRQGRVDTAPLTGIKPGKSPTVRVSYTYCGTLFEGVGSGGNILVSAGYTRQTGGIDSKNEISDIVIPEAAVGKDATDNNAHYDRAGLHANDFRIAGCTSDVRLSWRVTTDRKGGIGGNGCYWLYIDNIKVQIVQ